jgi:transporter family-2 protein
LTEQAVVQERRFSDTAALAVTIAAGALLALQARVNGQLGRHVGAVTAATVSFGIGTAILVCTVTATPRARRGVGRLLRRRGPVWWFLGGVAGAAVVGSAAAAVPQVGVSLVSVLLVAGATAGGLLVDAIGFGPSGRLRATVLRTAGTALAIVGVCVSAVGQHGSFRPALLALVGIAGVASAGQVAANGQLRMAADDARVAALVSFAVGTACLLALVGLLALAGHLPAVHWPGNPGLYIGGALGVIYIVIAAALVQRLGVLRLSLGTVGGQVVGAVVIDLVAPAPGVKLTTLTVVGALLTLVAVALTVRGQ